MNDLEAQIRDTLRRHEGEAPLFDASDARHASRRTRRRQILNVAALGIGALALTMGLVAGIGGLLRADPGPTVLHQPPSVVSPTPSDASDVHQWPSTSRNAPGLYSWDGPPYGDSYHLEGFMHNGYGSGDVEIRIDIGSADLTFDNGSTAVTIAGHDAIYRRTVGGRETWIVPIDGTTIVIELRAKPGTSPADLADAHAIIGSMRTEPQDNHLGFRLVFTLTTNDWDSG